MMKTKIVFAGTPDLAACVLASLLAEESFEVVLVLSQPDMPVGRKQIIEATPVKALALEHGIEVLQPQKIGSIAEYLRELAPDFLIVAAYAQLVPPEVLKIAKYESLNVHASLLPKYRGASVIQAPILNGDTESGVTIIRMVDKLDAGAIFAQQSLVIDKAETTESLTDKLAQLGGQLIVQTIKDIVAGKAQAAEQDPSLVTYVKKLTKADGLIDWTREAVYLERFVRAMSPWPSAWTWMSGRQLKILAISEIIELDTYKPGKVFVYNNQLAIQTGKGAVIVSRLQAEGKRPMSSQEFVNGYSEIVGVVLA